VEDGRRCPRVAFGRHAPSRHARGAPAAGVADLALSRAAPQIAPELASARRPLADVGIGATGVLFLGWAGGAWRRRRCQATARSGVRLRAAAKKGGKVLAALAVGEEREQKREARKVKEKAKKDRAADVAAENSPELQRALQRRDFDRILENFSDVQVSQLAEAVGIPIKGGPSGNRKIPKDILKKTLQTDEFLDFAIERLNESKAPQKVGFSPQARAEVDAALASKFVSTLEKLRSNLGTGPLLRDLVKMEKPEGSDAQTAADLDVDLPGILDVRLVAAGSKSRMPLDNLKVGKTVFGTVVGVSLHEGIRIDIGAEVDAMVPLKLYSHTAEVGTRFPLGSKVELKLLEIYTGPHASARRFPLIGSLAKALGETGSSSSTGLGKTSGSSTALRRSPDDNPDILHTARGDGTQSPGITLIQRLATAGLGRDASVTGGMHPALAAMPPRPAPEVVLTIGSDGALHEVHVPQEHRSGQTSKDSNKGAAAKKAWEDLIASELKFLSLELKCRDRVAEDLDVVEDDLAAGRAPSIATSVLGLTPLPGDDCRCVLPSVYGEMLRFKLFSFETPAQLQTWKTQLKNQFTTCWFRSDDQDGGNLKQVEIERLAVVFACADVRHARAARQVEAAELLRAGLGLPRTPEALEASRMGTRSRSLMQEMQRILAKNTELKDQRKLMIAGGWRQAGDDDADDDDDDDE